MSATQRKAISRRIWRSVAATILTFLAAAGTGWAQITTATVLGEVKDNTGAVLPGVTVTIRSTETGATRVLTTDAEGRYVATNMALGIYNVQAELAGFQTAARSNITLTLGQHAVVNFELGVGELQESLTVVGAAPTIETTSAVVANLVDSTQIRELPVNLRSYEQFALLQPGVILNQAATAGVFAGSGTSIAVAGARPSQNSFLLDGTDINQPYWNKTPGSVSGALPGVEAIREFNVVRENYSAEWGRSAGGIINAVSRSGTNRYTGSVYEFWRNSAMDARDFFDMTRTQRREFGLPEIPEFNRNQFGATLGGPFVRDRTFFFGNYEGLRERLGLTDNLFVPSLDARAGFLPNPTTGVLERINVHPVSRVLLNLYKLPNGRDLGNGVAEYRDTRLQKIRDDFFMARVDHRISDPTSIFVRYTYNDGRLTVPRDSHVQLTGFREEQKSRNQYLTFQLQRIFGGRTVNTTRLAFNRNYLDAEELDPDVAPPPELSFKPGVAVGTLTVGDISSFGRAATMPVLRISNVYQLQDDLAFELSRHSLKVGANIEWIQMDGDVLFRSNGTYDFASLRNFMLGIPRSFTGAAPGEDDGSRRYRQSMYGFYLQDNYQMTSNFSLNMGLRYEFVTVPTEADGKITNLRDVLNDTAFVVGDPFFKNPTLKNFAPRAGFAWNVGGRGRYSVRGGFGVFYDPFLQHQWGVVSRLNPPFFLQRELLNPPWPGGLAVALPASRVTPMAFEPEQPTVYRGSVNFQMEILPQTSVTIGYSRAYGRDLVSSSDKNQPPPIVLPDGRNFWPEGARRPNPAFGVIRTYDTNIRSWYNGLELSLQRRLTAGLQGQVSYTFSKAEDEGSGVNGAETLNTSSFLLLDPNDPSKDKGLSAFHQRHNFAANFLYQLPFGRDQRWGSGLSGVVGRLAEGWAVHGIFRSQSGTPLSLLLGFNRARNLSGDISDRPDLLPGFGPDDVIIGTPERYFDSSAFALPEAGTHGNLPRNWLPGPPYRIVDLSLVKDTRFGERMVQFRAEFFNILNHTNFGPPNRRVFNDASGRPSPTAGRITTTASRARQVQLGVKFLF